MGPKGEATEPILKLDGELCLIHIAEDLYEILEETSEMHGVPIDRLVHTILGNFFESSTMRTVIEAMKNAEEAV